MKSEKAKYEDKFCLDCEDNYLCDKNRCIKEEQAEKYFDEAYITETYEQYYNLE